MNWKILSLFFLSSLIFGFKDFKDTNETILTLGAYSVPKEVYQKEIIPAFQEHWLNKTGVQVRFEESYIASGAQSSAIIAGSEAIEISDKVVLINRGHVGQISSDKQVYEHPKKGDINRCSHFEIECMIKNSAVHVIEDKSNVLSQQWLYLYISNRRSRSHRNV